MKDEEWLKSISGVNMPRLIYGTAWKKKRTAELVVKAVEAGFRGIDTACQPKHYSEPLVGKALQHLQDKGYKRENLFVQTKFTPLKGQDPNNIPYDEHATSGIQVAQSFEVSQKNLRTDYVDSLVLHSPLASHQLLMTVWQAMEVIYHSGGANQLGISNCHNLAVLKNLYKEARIKPAVVQNRFYDKSRYDIELRKWCADKGIIYQSFWTLSANPHILASDTVTGIAMQLDKTPAQILFRYLTQCGIVPLTGTSSEQHMIEDLNVVRFELSPEEMERVGGLLV